MNLIDFWTNTKPTAAGCLEWQGWRSNGYGQLSDEVGKTQWAHRVAYQLAKGSIPDGLQIDHLCRNRRCVNPDHLEAVTSQTNTLRGVSPTAVNAARTECVHGHAFDSANTYRDRQGQRHCRRCRAIRMSRARCGRAVGR